MLTDKVSQLKGKGLEAVRLAMLWEQYIDLHGEQKAVDFYQHIGLNHLQTKSIEWEGLTLSREPTKVEKFCVKSISQAQDAGKASVTKVLLQVRSALIDDGLNAIKNLSPATYHELILTVPDTLHDDLREQARSIFNKGRKLVSQELSRGKQQANIDDTDDDELDELTNLTDARIANEVQTRVSSAAARFALLGLSGAVLWKAVRDELEAGSLSYIGRASTGLANRVLNFGRSREADDRKDEWQSVEYSALLDQNVCDPCAAEDGQSASSESDLQPAPNPECEGEDWCRCFHVYILDTVA